jgi:hypothetical protein
VNRPRLVAERLAGAHIAVEGRPDWIFIKMYCHGFFDLDQPAVIGETMRRGLEESLDLAERTGKFKLHFASAREAFNMTMAAVEGHAGEPGKYRDHKLKQIMANVNLSLEREQVPAAV